MPDIKAEVIFVDDGSTDNSLNIIKSNSHDYYHARIIKLAKNSGSHAAVRAGIFNSKGSNIVIMAADLQDPLSLIKELYTKCLEGFDIVIAQRKIIKTDASTRIFSRFYSFLMRKYAIKDYPERGADVIMFNSKIREVINCNIEANSNVILQILSLGFKKTFIEYTKVERKFGVTKWTLSKKIKLMIDSFVAFSYAPIRFVTIMGLIFSFVGFLWIAYIVIRAIFIGDLSQGWPALMSVLLLCFGITNISLGIIAEYLWRTLDASRKRPVFIIDEIIELNK
jgi:dolichol-phosphate mannosyltransferase